MTRHPIVSQPIAPVQETPCSRSQVQQPSSSSVLSSLPSAHCAIHLKLHKPLQEPPPPLSSTMGRKDKKQQQKDEEKPAAEKNAGSAKGGKKEQPAKEEKVKGGKKGKK
ncbi:hypothetical protein PHYPSEUDO_003719 [Phytophthora pseudosyringae]|uniref:Uncharacterized protein n=1 Tax=Phytophthora pseudosyringae TaxID=221518 RepID=A0A8T1V6B7_9STRA|nr:hypothetical protein PHYPSEUDO_003719 [Phytophthora pseudosyringae]